MNFQRRGFGSSFNGAPRKPKIKETPKPAHVFEPAPAETKPFPVKNLQRGNPVISNGVIRTFRTTVSDRSDGLRIIFEEGDSIPVGRDDDIDVPKNNPA